jgi:hypothetical protein
MSDFCLRRFWSDMWSDMASVGTFEFRVERPAPRRPITLCGSTPKGPAKGSHSKMGIGGERLFGGIVITCVLPRGGESD